MPKARLMFLRVPTFAQKRPPFLNIFTLRYMEFNYSKTKMCNAHGFSKGAVAIMQSNLWPMSKDVRKRSKEAPKEYGKTRGARLV